mmetsp:Transcript_27255/g.91192  ORF Transcript_27255/g.91192 Transcript_27255/m.91192 type:complete len:204 (-) Transcript_27255:387-998(-)
MHAVMPGPPEPHAYQPKPGHGGQEESVFEASRPIHGVVCAGCHTSPPSARTATAAALDVPFVGTGAGGAARGAGGAACVLLAAFDGPILPALLRPLLSTRCPCLRKYEESQSYGRSGISMTRLCSAVLRIVDTWCLSRYSFRGSSFEAATCSSAAGPAGTAGAGAAPLPALPFAGLPGAWALPAACGGAEGPASCTRGSLWCA